MVAFSKDVVARMIGRKDRSGDASAAGLETDPVQGEHLCGGFLRFSCLSQYSPGEVGYKRAGCGAGARKRDNGPNTGSGDESNDGRCNSITSNRWSNGARAKHGAALRGLRTLVDGGMRGGSMGGGSGALGPLVRGWNACGDECLLLEVEQCGVDRGVLKYSMFNVSGASKGWAVHIMSLSGC